MAKKRDKHITINRNRYNDLKRMDHNSLEDYLNQVYEQGMAAGKEKGITEGKLLAGPRFRAEEALAAIGEIKGIGKEKLSQIRLAMMAAGALIDQKDAERAIEVHKKLGKTNQYIKLLQENPGIDTICWVDSEIVADDGYMRWQGALGSAYIQEYTFETTSDWRESKELVCKDDTESLEEYLYTVKNMDEAAVEEYIKNIPWKRAIFLDINLPKD